MKLPKQLWIMILLLLTFSHFATAQISVTRQKVTKDISMEVPESFIPMSQSELIGKYVSSRTPIAMYTSEDRNIDLGINETSSAWAGDDLPILQAFYKANIANLFTEVEFLQEEIREIGGRPFIVFEFISKITDEGSTFGGNSSISKYTYIQYTLRNNKVLLFNFTCPLRARPQWQETAQRMMESVRIKS